MDLRRWGTVAVLRWLAIASIGLTGLLVCVPGSWAGTRYEVKFRSAISGPVDLPAACKAKRAELFPQLGVAPDTPRRLTALYQQDGMLAAVGARSADGGRRWRRGAVTDASACTGGPAQRRFLVNPQVAVGPDRTAYFGSSWFGQEGPFFAYDVEVHGSTDGVGWSPGVSPAGANAQNIGIAPHPSEPDVVNVAWSHFDQVPNPATYAPLSVSVRAAVSRDGGESFSQPVTVFDPAPGTFVVNVRLLRGSDDALLAIFDTVPAEKLVTALVGEPVRLMAFATRSRDGGATWSPPVEAGVPVQFGYTDESSGAFYGSAKFDAAIGRGGNAAVVWAEPANEGRSAIQLTRSHDGGRTWSAPRAVVTSPDHLIEPAVAIAGDGRTGLFYYSVDPRALSVNAWFASRRRASWRRTQLAGPFDLRRSHDPSLAYDGGTSLGVYQDLTAIRRGFGAAYTVGPPLTDHGPTDVIFARIVRRRG